MNPVVFKLAASLLLNNQGRPRPLVAAAVALAVLVSIAIPAGILGVLGYGLVAITGAAQPANAAPPVYGCSPTQESTSGLSISSLTSTQLRHAHQIIRTGVEQQMPSYGIVIALAVAAEESSLRVLANDGKGGDLRPDQRRVAASLELPHDGVGSDHGSLGLFQQQWPDWGAMTALMNPAGSAGKFYTALRKVPGWQQMPLTVAAQRVQRSAFPNAYAPFEHLARSLLAQISGRGDICGTGGGMSCPATSFPAEDGLTPDALRVLRCEHQYFPAIRRWVGVYPGGDHTSGRAVDAMVPHWNHPGGRRLGWRIANWARHHATRLGVSYVIFYDHIWSVRRASAGWRPYTNPYVPPAQQTPTSRHLNHVHVSVYGDAASSTNDRALGRVGLPVPPSSYTLGAAFGQCGSHWVSCHTGQDFVVPTGTTVRAVAAGTVTYTGWGGPYGWLTKIDHGDGLQTWYAHQSRQLVHAGQHVRVGQPIGASGDTGNTTGPHLHLEVRTQGVPIDPVPWLRAHGVDP